VVPLPRCRGGGKWFRSRDAIAPELCSILLPKAEGAERRKARTVETALARRGAHLAIGAQRLPALHCGARQAVTPDSTPGRVSWNRRVRTGGPSPAPVQRAPRGPVVVPDERGPEAARERTANPRAGTAFAPYSGLPREHALNERSDLVGPIYYLPERRPKLLIRKGLGGFIAAIPLRLKTIRQALFRGE
jgi:hypothetical protein